MNIPQMQICVIWDLTQHKGKVVRILFLCQMEQNLTWVLSLLFTKTDSRGGEGLLGKETCCQAQQPKFNP